MPPTAMRALAVFCAALSGVIAACLPAWAEAPSAEAMVGRWGLAAYFREADATLVTRAARGACGAPYIIARGPNGGVMLNLPDQPQKTEHVLKTSWSGKTYVGPPGQAGGPADREVVSFAPGQFVLRWVDPSVGSRYGVMVFVRCGGR
jgi:hypothetical protein